MTTHSSILAWRILWTEEPGVYRPQGCKEADTTEATWHACVQGLSEVWFLLFSTLDDASSGGN